VLALAMRAEAGCKHDSNNRAWCRGGGRGPEAEEAKVVAAGEDERWEKRAMCGMQRWSCEWGISLPFFVGETTVKEQR
jgi:hypothetical protein